MGWLGTQGVSSPSVIEACAPFVRHTHVKDVKAAGKHDTCFLGEGTAALAGVVLTVSGCGGGYSSPSSPSMPSSSAPSPSGGSASDESGTISNNHGHVAMVTGAQLVAGNAVQLDIRGSADHTHTVTLPIEALKAIQGGQPVATDSTSVSSHVHTVTFNSDSPDSPSHY